MWITHREAVIKCISFILILSNCIIRSRCPSQYVPIQRTCRHYLGSPYFARTLATFAEFAFYRQVARTIGLSSLWFYGVLLGLWFVAELLSWIGLIFQNQLANATEDITWCIWFIVAFCYSSSPARFLLIPIILYYAFVHIPFLIRDLQSNTVNQNNKDPLVEKLDKSGYWVVMSVKVKLIVYLLFVMIEYIEK